MNQYDHWLWHTVIRMSAQLCLALHRINSLFGLLFPKNCFFFFADTNPDQLNLDRVHERKRSECNFFPHTLQFYTMCNLTHNSRYISYFVHNSWFEFSHGSLRSFVARQLCGCVKNDKYEVWIIVLKTANRVYIEVTMEHSQGNFGWIEHQRKRK